MSNSRNMQLWEFRKTCRGVLSFFDSNLESVLNNLYSTFSILVSLRKQHYWGGDVVKLVECLPKHDGVLSISPNPVKRAPTTFPCQDKKENSILQNRRFKIASNSRSSKDLLKNSFAPKANSKVTKIKGPKVYGCLPWSFSVKCCSSILNVS